MMKWVRTLKKHCALYRVLPLKHRYLFTRQNRLRFRYIALPVLCAFGASLFTWAPSAQIPAFSNTTADTSHIQLASNEKSSPKTLEPMQNKMRIKDGKAINAQQHEGTISTAAKSHVSAFSNIQMASFIKAEPTKKPAIEYPREKTLEVGKGDTISGLLQKNGATGTQAYDIVKSLSQYTDVRKIRPGQTLNLIFDKSRDSDEEILQALNMNLGPIKTVRIDRTERGKYEANLKEKKVYRRYYVGETEIQTSLYGSAARSGIPPSVIARMIKIYSWAVDFQRDLRTKDSLQVIYEVQETEDGDVVGYGQILYANLNLNGTDLPLYRYEHKDGHTDYYDEKGQSIKKTLMKTPVDGARISSGFGMRRHPVLGYGKMHKGVDFAAPMGTPIYAAGDGIIRKIGRNGSFGNYIRIRHNGQLETAYAHMQRFAKGKHKGSRVKQGEVIGYIGTTGRSTGPHLHYEVLMNNKQVNPKRIDLPVGEHLKGQTLTDFQAKRKDILKLYSTLRDRTKMAANASEKNKKNKS